VCEGSFFPTSSPTFVVDGVFDDSYSNRGLTPNFVLHTYTHTHTHTHIYIIPIRFIFHISYITLSLPCNPLPTPLKAIARRFFVLFHIGI
jgi:hypothetical protein